MSIRKFSKRNSGSKIEHCKGRTGAALYRYGSLTSISGNWRLADDLGAVERSIRTGWRAAGALALLNWVVRQSECAGESGKDWQRSEEEGIKRHCKCDKCCKVLRCGS